MSEQGTEKTNPLHGLEPEQQEQQRCECGQSDFDGRVWSWRGVGTRRVCVANSTLSGYCPACGCRLSVVDGEPVVGPSQGRLLAALYREICLYGQCPGELQDFACPQEHEADKHGPCWLIYYSLATTYADAQALWARMEEAASDDTR